MPQTKEYYLSKGFDDAMAEYLSHGRKKITAVLAHDNFKLTLIFLDGEHRLLDCYPFLKPGTVFAPFLDIEKFKRVYLDEDHCVSWDIDPLVDSRDVWSNKVTLCSDMCYVDSIPIGGGCIDV